MPASSDYGRTILGAQPRAARATLLAWLLTTVLAVATTHWPAASAGHAPILARPGDNELYWAVADRIRRGEGYYTALAKELRLRGYPTRSVFNWRTPLPIWLIGHLPYPWLGRATLALLGLAMLVLGTVMVLREDRPPLGRDVTANVAGTRRVPSAVSTAIIGRHTACACYIRDRPRVGRALLTALLLSGPAWVCGMRGLFISMHELWAGTLIAISVGALGLGWRGPAIAAGLLAPFFRELALPYPLLCAALAWRQRRYKEFALWVAGLLAWAAYFAMHWLEVTRVMPPGGRFHAHSWVQFGGLPFIIASMSANFYLLLSPPWVAAVYFAAAIFGLLGWHTVGGRQVAITVSLFVLLFSVVGQPFNLYWGMLYAPLLCFGAARFPAWLHDLWIAAGWGRRARKYVRLSSLTEETGQAGKPDVHDSLSCRGNNLGGVAAGANTAWRLVDRATGEVVVPKLILADRFWPRLVGLQFRAGLPQGSGLLLVPCSSVHTCFCRFPIDLVCLDRRGRVLQVRKCLRPWRAAVAPAGTHAILETAAGEMAFAVGQVLAVKPPIGGNAEPPRSLRFLL